VTAPGTPPTPVTCKPTRRRGAPKPTDTAWWLCFLPLMAAAVAAIQQLT
jgi:hypothetical protein